MTFITGAADAIGPIVVVFIAAGLIALALTPLVRRIVLRYEVVDHPEARRINTIPVPRGGGLAVCAAFLLVASVFVRNVYCRLLCPVGAALGIISNLTVFKIKRWSECKTCKICEKTCEWGAIRGPVIVKSECVRCDDCERLYMDQQKCPHWIIIRKRSEVEARLAASRVIG